MSASESRTRTSGGLDLIRQKAEGRRQKWVGRQHQHRSGDAALLPSAFCLDHSTNVTLLISRNVVVPSITFSSADSRRKFIPSSLAAFLISEAGRRSIIMPRIRSERSRSSEMAARPWKPVPLQSMQPAPSQKVFPL